MEERYVISIKARKDVMGRDCEEWRYAGNDDGAYGSGYPCWHSGYSFKTFGSVESAKEWFDKTKSFLLGPHFEKDNLDIKTLGVRKVIYKKVMSL